MQKRKRYTKEFKLEILRLMKASGKPAAEVKVKLRVSELKWSGLHF